MIFDVAPRMKPIHVSDQNGQAFNTQSATASHLGPGSYYTVHNENIRAGWIKRSFSNRQPMVKTGRGKNCLSHNSAGVLINGLHAHGNSINDTPGPGHYNLEKPAVAVLRQGSSGKFDPYRSHITSASTGGTMGSTSPRMLMPSASLKSGVLFHGKIDDHSHLGPGQYHNNLENSMVKKSFNTRVNSPRSPHQRQQRHPQSQYNQYSQYSPSQMEGEYSGVYSPRYVRQQEQDSPSPSHYINAGEIDEAYLYEDSTAAIQQQEVQPSSVFHVAELETSPIQQCDANGAPIHMSGKKKGRKMGRMSVMENMVPEMYRKKV